MKLNPSYSTLSEQELLDKVVPQYKVDNPKACRFWERGVNDTYQLHTANQLYSLRVYRHGLRARAEIEFEMAAMDHLHQRGFSLANPIRKHDGGFITEIYAPEGLRYAVVTSHAKGEGMDYSDAKLGGQFGESVGMLHNLTDDFQTTFERPRLEVVFLLNDSLAVVNPFLNDLPDEAQFLKTTAEEIRYTLARANLYEFDSGFCHGDIHGYNAHIDNGVITHYDFDCCGMGYRLFDIATFVWNVWHHDNGGEVCNAFLDGYRSVRKLSDDELELLEPFIIIRHIWWMNLHAGNAMDFGYSITQDGAFKRKLKYIEHVLDGKVRKALARS